jgi:hypothetical protein
MFDDDSAVFAANIDVLSAVKGTLGALALFQARAVCLHESSASVPAMLQRRVIHHYIFNRCKSRREAVSDMDIARECMLDGRHTCVSPSVECCY